MNGVLSFIINMTMPRYLPEIVCRINVPLVQDTELKRRQGQKVVNRLSHPALRRPSHEQTGLTC